MAAKGCNCTSCKCERRAADFAQQATAVINQQMSSSIFSGMMGQAFGMGIGQPIFNIDVPRPPITAVLKTACGCVQRVRLPKWLPVYEVHIALGLPDMLAKAPPALESVVTTRRRFICGRRLNETSWEYNEEVSQTQTEKIACERADASWQRYINQCKISDNLRTRNANQTESVRYFRAKAQVLERKLAQRDTKLGNVRRVLDKRFSE